MFYSYKQLDCALGSEVISEISLNRPELRPDTYLPSPYYIGRTTAPALTEFKLSLRAQPSSKPSYRTRNKPSLNKPG